MPSKTAAPAAPTTNQPTVAPTRKLAFAGGIGMPLTMILVAVVKGFGFDLPDEVVGAIGSLITFGIGYVVPERS